MRHGRLHLVYLHDNSILIWLFVRHISVAEVGDGTHIIVCKNAGSTPGRGGDIVSSDAGRGRAGCYVRRLSLAGVLDLEEFFSFLKSSRDLMVHLRVAK